MGIFSKQKKEETDKEPGKSDSVGLEGFEQQLDNTLREEHTQVIADKREESKSKAMVFVLCKHYRNRL